MEAGPRKAHWWSHESGKRRILIADVVNQPLASSAALPRDGIVAGTALCTLQKTSEIRKFSFLWSGFLFET
jgi:hypothetical protein